MHCVHFARMFSFLQRLERKPAKTCLKQRFVSVSLLSDVEKQIHAVSKNTTIKLKVVKKPNSSNNNDVVFFTRFADLRNRAHSIDDFFRH